MENKKEKLIQSLEKGIAIAHELNADFIYLTIGEAKAALNLFKGQEKFEQQYSSFNGSEEVYGEHYDTAGNFHWYGTETGYHVIYKRGYNND